MRSSVVGIGRAPRKWTCRSGRPHRPANARRALRARHALVALGARKPRGACHALHALRPLQPLPHQTRVVTQDLSMKSRVVRNFSRPGGKDPTPEAQEDRAPQ
jgi:hypothetical protein